MLKEGSKQALILRWYWHIGKEIIEEEQKGNERADYGKSLLKLLSKRLQGHYKRGFSVDILERSRKFYLIFQKYKEIKNSATPSRNSVEPAILPNLSWSHYVELLKEKRSSARSFYALESSKNHWSVRELSRQRSALLYDRISNSKEPEELLALEQHGHEIAKPEDAIKNPVVLEFLGIPEPHKLNETELEKALINNLQTFLLELGRGFAFVARQQRLTLENDHFYADLVFYHIILKCYVVIDLKTRKLHH